MNRNKGKSLELNLALNQNTQLQSKTAVRTEISAT